MTQRLWAGGYTADAGGAGDGVHGLSASANGGLRDLGLLVEAASPSFLAQHPVLPVLYAVLEVRGSVAAYSVSEDCSLAPLGPTGHAGPGACHIAVDPGGRFVIVSCWGSGEVVLHRLDHAGRLIGRIVAPAASDPHAPGTLTPGPDPDPGTGESRRSRAHAALVLADGRLVTTDLGYDLLRFWTYSTGSGLSVDHEVVLPAGTGPRHIVEHPDGRVLVVTEYSCEVVALARADRRGGAQYLVTGVACLGRSRPGDKASELTLSPDGKHLYVSVRGSDRLVTLAVGNGQLEPIADMPSGGRCPRTHIVDSAQLHVAHEESHEVVTLYRNPVTGIPGAVRGRVALGSPTTLVRAR